MTRPDPSGPVRTCPGPAAVGSAAAGAAQRALAAPSLAEFAARPAAVTPVRARWTRGSPALGDHRHGRSDLDLVALLPAAPDDRPLGRLAALRRELIEQEPDAAGPHCGRLPAGESADPAAAHFVFARGEPIRRPVAAVIRSELLDEGELLAGERPGAAAAGERRRTGRLRPGRPARRPGRPRPGHRRPRHRRAARGPADHRARGDRPPPGPGSFFWAGGRIR
ncbi:hypothetical protein GCM10009759_44270 [Kitasatospora saccharophila]|uniref:Nucleotidyltransferase-like protein n=1 Tax=Kitasatospora saccharophila TaxID=407973 RepID=A0ABN2X9X4_9ACTN